MLRTVLTGSIKVKAMSPLPGAAGCPIQKYPFWPLAFNRVAFSSCGGECEPSIPFSMVPNQYGFAWLLSLFCQCGRRKFCTNFPWAFSHKHQIRLSSDGTEFYFVEITSYPNAASFPSFNYYTNMMCPTIHFIKN